MGSRHRVLSLVLLLSATATLAQRLAWRAYGTREGLTNLSVRAVQQDRDGFLWVGTDNGLFRYDGSRFTRWTAGVASGEIYALAESPDGELWAMSSDGAVLRKAGARFELVDVGTRGRLSQPAGLAFDARGDVYLLQPQGLVRGHREGQGAWRFESVVQGELRALSTGGGRVRYLDGAGHLFELGPSGPEPLGARSGLPSDPSWKCLFVDRAGQLWARSTTLLQVLAPSAERFVDRSAGVPTHSKNACTMSDDEHGNLFVPSDQGVAVVSARDVRRLDASVGFPGETVLTSVTVRDGSLWVGTFGRGLVRPLGRGEWLSWRREDGLAHNSVWAVLRASDQRVWVGTTGGLDLIGADDRVQRALTGQSDGAYVLVETGEHEVLALSSSGLTRLDLDGRVLQRLDGAFGAHRIDALALGPDGRLWVVGAHCWRTREPVRRGVALTFEELEVPAPVTFRHVLVDRAGVAWLSGPGGLWRHDGATWRQLTEADGLRSGNVAMVSEDAGGLWVSYRDPLGLTRLLDGPAPKLTHVALPTAAAVYATATDPRGRLWVSTDVGLYRRDGEDAWRHFDSDDGVVWDDGNDLALLADARGQVWVGTSNGLTRYSPEFESTQTLPVARFVSAEAEGGPLPLDAPARLPWVGRSLTLKLGTRDFLYETRTRFRYRLVGDASWRETSERTLQFVNLRPGDYRLEVLAGTPTGWSAGPAHFDFTIEPPWWLRWWALAAGTALAALALGGVVRLRVRQVEAQKRELERLVAERTAEARDAAKAKSAFLANMSHEIRTPMNAVIGLTDLLTAMDLPAEARANLATVRASGEALLAIINDVLDFSKIESGKLLIDRQSFDLDQLVEDALAVAAATSHGSQLELEGVLHDDVPRFFEGDAVRVRQVLLNLLSNAVKFTERGKVRVVVRCEPGALLHFEVRDDGIGLTDEAKARLFREFTQADASTTRRFGGTGLGLAISKRLVEAMGGTIHVESAPGQGSTFHFTVRGAVGAGVSAPPVSQRALLVGEVPALEGLAQHLRRRGVGVDVVAQGGPFGCEQHPVAFVTTAALEAVAGLAAALRAAGARRVVEVTARRTEPHPSVEAVVSKPFKVAALLEVLGAAGSPDTRPVLEAQVGLDVLVAEDNVVNQRVTTALLQRLGHRVEVAADGQQALEALARRAFDVVLMDVQMPVLDGLAATRALRVKGHTLRVVALTAGASTEDEAQCLAAGMDGFLSKPVRLEELRGALAKVKARPK